MRQRLASCYTKIQILRINGLRTLGAQLAERDDPGVKALGATNKMFWSEMHQEAMELALDIHGAEAMLIDAGGSPGSWPGTLPRRLSPFLSRVADDDGVLLLPLGDDLGSNRPDPSATSSPSGFSACPKEPRPATDGC